jgi:hypothetical protein
MITFHAEKDAINRRKHGISLGHAEDFDFDTAEFAIDDREDYGEIRIRGIGFLDARLHVLVFTLRGEDLRPISLRKATKHEQKKYTENH